MFNVMFGRSLYSSCTKPKADVLRRPVSGTAAFKVADDTTLFVKSVALAYATVRSSVAVAD